MTTETSQLRYWPWIVLTSVALFIAIKASPYVTTNTDFFDPLFRANYASYLPVVLAHGASAILALAIGPFQFAAYPAGRLRLWHRRLGYIYLSCILVGSITGFYMGLHAYGGRIGSYSPRVAFSLFAIGWLTTGWLALSSAKRRDFARHREWMIRNYAFTFGAAILRIHLNWMQRVGFQFEDIYPYLAWISWIPNLIFAEWLIRRGRRGTISAKSGADRARAVAPPQEKYGQ